MKGKPLHPIPDSFLSASNGDVVALEALISNGVRINEQDKRGWTALMYASSKGHVPAVKLLLNAGADVNITDSKRRTAADIANENNHYDIYYILRDHTCPFCSEPPVDDKSCLHYLGGGDRGNDELTLSFDFAGPVYELVDLIRELDETTYETLLEHAPKELVHTFELVRKESFYYWTYFDEVYGLDLICDSGVAGTSAVFTDYFHLNPNSFVKAINEKAESSLAWLKERILGASVIWVE